jgi:hypothetical protein
MRWYCLLHALLHKVQVGIFALVADVEVLDVKVDLNFRAPLVMPSFDVVVESALPRVGTTALTLLLVESSTPPLLALLAIFRILSALLV